MNTWIHCHDSYHYQSPIGGSELFLELLESLSELKSVLEVVELIVDLDSEVLQFKFGILIAKSAIFWTKILIIYCTQSAPSVKDHLQRVFQWGILFFE